MKGKLVVITGPIYSGKTDEMLRLMKRAELEKKRVLAFKCSMDGVNTRFFIMGHNGVSLPCIPLPAWISEETIDIYAPHVWTRADFYAFDEAHLFREGIVGICERLRSLGKEVIVSGRDLDWDGHPSGFMPVLMSLADEVIKLAAVCTMCGEPATRTKRIGASREEPRCLMHWMDLCQGEA
jgi:thymidine kinase